MITDNGTSAFWSAFELQQWQVVKSCEIYFSACPRCGKWMLIRNNQSRDETTSRPATFGDKDPLSAQQKKSSEATKTENIVKKHTCVCLAPEAFLYKSVLKG